MTRPSAFLVLLLLSIFLSACDQHVDSVADWEKTTTPVFAGMENPPKKVGTYTIWRRDNVEYWDTNKDGIIDQRQSIESGGKSVQWYDLNADGIFDLEHIVIRGNFDPADAKTIAIPVPATK